MIVGPDLRQRTPKGSVGVIAGGVVLMDDKVRVSTDRLAVRAVARRRVFVQAQGFRRTDRDGLRRNLQLRVAVVRVGMLRGCAAMYALISCVVCCFMVCLWLLPHGHSGAPESTLTIMARTV